MIARLLGKLVEKQAPTLVVDVNGVGYEVLAPMTTFYSLPELGEQVALHTHFSVSENAQQLFGFYRKQERSLFRLLIKVNGVGPKMALGILSGMDSNEFVNCVADNNIAALVKVPGVGKKTAERLVIEMRDKLKDWQGDASTKSVASSQTNENINAPPRVNDLLAEAESALVALGYKPAEAAKAISAVERNNAGEDFQRSEQLIRLALKSMMPS